MGILYYKIYIQESYYFKTLYNYIYPPNQIIYAKLYNHYKSINITDQFISIVNQNDSTNIKWKDLLNLLDNNNYINQSHLDIRYMIGDNYYKIMYNYKKNDIIKFPPYIQDEIEQYNKDKKYKKTILYAELSDKENMKDITQLIKEYAGPLNDFYKNHHNIKIYVNLIKNNKGK